MNKVFLIGNLTKDTELSETSNGIAVCRFSIAVQRKFASASGEKETDFFNCTAWRGQAEAIHKYTSKGKKIAVIGSIQNRTYEAQDGTKMHVTDIIVNEVEFLSYKDNSSDNNNYQKQEQNEKPKLEAYEDDDDSPF